MVLIMTVEPGFGGQKFLDLCLPKIRRARALMDKHGVETWLQVDGGVSLETIERCAEAGADVFVAGSAVYSADDPDRMVAELRAARPRRADLTRVVTSADGGPSAGRRSVRRVTRSRGDRVETALWQTRPDEFSSSRALGSVKFRAGGD